MAGAAYRGLPDSVVNLSLKAARHRRFQSEGTIRPQLQFCDVLSSYIGIKQDDLKGSGKPEPLFLQQIKIVEKQ